MVTWNRKKQSDQYKKMGYQRFAMGEKWLVTESINFINIEGSQQLE